MTPDCPLLSVWHQFLTEEVLEPPIGASRFGHGSRDQRADLAQDCLDRLLQKCATDCKQDVIASPQTTLLVSAFLVKSKPRGN